jgi:hypothetical protein
MLFWREQSSIGLTFRLVPGFFAHKMGSHRLLSRTEATAHRLPPRSEANHTGCFPGPKRPPTGCHPEAKQITQVAIRHYGILWEPILWAKNQPQPLQQPVLRVLCLPKCKDFCFLVRIEPGAQLRGALFRQGLPPLNDISRRLSNRPVL